MNTTKKIFLLITVFLPLTLTGCIQVKTAQQNTTAIDGGIFRTADKGNTWQQKVLIPTVTGAPQSFAGINIKSIAIDPNDNNAIYYGSVGQGLIYTYNRGETWQVTQALGASTISSVAIDANDKCTIYATINNKAYKSTDCNRSYDVIYQDHELYTTVDAVAVDHYDGSVVYLGIARGDLLKSADGGASWHAINRFNVKITKIIMDPNDSRKIYVVTQGRGIFRTLDRGENWEDMNKPLTDLQVGLDIKDLVLVKSEPDTIFIATMYGLLRSVDSGDTWEKIKLIPSENRAQINALAVNPQNSKEIYYVTNTTFYRSLDGGENWTTLRVPSTRWATKLLIDPVEPNVIYLGVWGNVQ